MIICWKPFLAEGSVINLFSVYSVSLLVFVRLSFSGNNQIFSWNQFSAISVFWQALWYENMVKPKQTV